MYKGPLPNELYSSLSSGPFKLTSFSKFKKGIDVLIYECQNIHNSTK
ncbi:hypothetical protein HMPREF0322_01740 [Desulfitobacterium hafniense DP7]|uniref:Uncharacterized protein n=1 Tax=Desulfitobacterium hafniense DP7 TaxID=537010 RepID=G9XLA6_DESHA|nr:hypothetical protein HMPREF0322_01740 [Desulfitobacterium hafniense DP7]